MKEGLAHALRGGRLGGRRGNAGLGGTGKAAGGQGQGQGQVGCGNGRPGSRGDKEGRGRERRGLDPGRETSHHPPEGPEVDPDVDCQAGGRRESQNLPRVEAGRAG